MDVTRCPILRHVGIPLCTVPKRLWDKSYIYCAWCATTKYHGFRYYSHMYARVPAFQSYEDIVIMKKPETVAKAKADQVSLPDDAFVKKHPCIVEYLATVQYEDGSDREPSALSVSLGEGMVKLALNDKDLKQSMYTAAGSLQEALQLMEGALRAKNAEWRSWNSGKQKRK